MTSEWNHFALGEITELVIDYRGKTPKKLGGDWCKQGYRALSAKNIKTGRIVQAETIRYIDESLYRKWMKDEVQRGDILITSEAPFGQIFFWDSDEKIVLSQRLFCVRIKPEYDARFIYYYMTTPEFQSELDGRATGTTVIGLRQPELMKCVIRCPEIQEQKVIAAILSSIDAKIIANEKVNDNLQQQAAAIFRSWFVDCAPFGGKAPDEWENVTLEDITALVSRGITPKYADDTDQIVINQKCIRNHTIDLTLARTHTPKIINEKWLRFGDLLINSTGDGTLGRAAQVWFQPKNLTVDSHVTIARPAKENLIFYIGLWGILHEKEIESLHTGSTGQTELPRDRVKAMELLLPDNETLDRFNGLITPMAAAIVANQEENNRLAALRDAILPKLMSGEIDVSAIQL